MIGEEEEEGVEIDTQIFNSDLVEAATTIAQVFLKFFEGWGVA